MIVLCLILIIAPLPVKLRWDWGAWHIKKRINHPLRLLAIGALMLALDWLAWRIGPIRYYAQAVVLSWAIFWMFFDYLINFFCQRDWWYIPEKTDKDASWTDVHVYAELGWKKLLVLRLCFLAVAIACNLWIFR